MTTRPMQTALVTGAAGFVGSHLTDALLRQHIHVVGLDNLSTGTRANLHTAFEYDHFALIEGDIREADVVKEACANVDVVFHLAAVTKVSESIREPQKYHDINVTGTQNILAGAVQAKIRHVVFTSSAAVYGTPETIPVPEEATLNPLSPYGSSKVEAEAACQKIAAKHNLQLPRLRFFNIYGPRQPIDTEAGVVAIFLDRARSGHPLIIYGDGHQTRDFIFIEDVVETLIRAATLNDVLAEPINVGRGEAVTIRELAEAIQQLVPTCSPEIIFEKPRPGDIYHSVGKINRMKEQLQYMPKFSLHEGLAKTCNY
ncbi:MAG: NAD-dependent epimerase/dehydratase family protein [candidate division Zixibacteria bacterium]|nr:NAD-dependent epimerase/dehydratase family protein [candidate division Zixibacteria bacterium]